MTLNHAGGSLDSVLRRPEALERGVAAPMGDAAPASRKREEIGVPEGTDENLWRILSREERERLDRVGAMGPLTYGYLIHSGRTDLPVVRGGRIDIKA